MSKFHVRASFEIQERELFVMAGSILEGEVRKGMFARIRFNSALEMTVRIKEIEFARRQGGEDVCLCFGGDPELVRFLRSLDIRDEVVEVTVEGSD